MLYHVSSQAGLKTILPHVSTHKKAYVYAIDNMVTGLLFGAKMDDFDFMISTDENGLPLVCECYPDAFQKVYQGKACSVYVVEDTGFQRGVTSWSAELVCEQEVKVTEEIVVEDLYQRLLLEEQHGNLKIMRYALHGEYRKKIASHIVDRLFRFQIDLSNCMERDVRFATYYKDTIQALVPIMNGCFLQ